MRVIKGFIVVSIVLGLSLNLTACGGGSSTQSNPNGNVSNLSFAQPYLIPSFQNTSSSGYILVQNNSTEAVSNITYSINNQIQSGASATIDSISANKCKAVNVGSQCILKINLAAGAYSGSFSISASNDSNNTQNSIAAVNVSNKLIGIQPVITNNESGVNGINLYYYNTILNGTPAVVVTGAVASANVGGFNTATLVDESNQPLPGQFVISNNLGNNYPNLESGSSFSIVLIEPLANQQPINFKLQISENGNTPQTALVTNSIIPVSNQAIFVTYPEFIYLTANFQQIQVAVANIGDKDLNQFTLTNNNSGIIDIFQYPASSINVNQFTSYIVQLLVNPPPTVPISLTNTYNNGQTTQSNITSGSTSNSQWPVDSENGVVIISGTPAVQTGFSYSSVPSSGNWSSYQSGTTAGIINVAANSTNTSALHVAYNSESAGILLSNNNNGQYINNTSPTATLLATQSNPLLVAGSGGFVISGGTAPNTIVYFESNNGTLSQSVYGGTVANLTIDTIANLNNQYYIYDKTDNLIINSTDGINWSNINSVSPESYFSNVIQVSAGVYAAIDVNNNVYLGDSPTSINNLVQSGSKDTTAIAADNGQLVIATINNYGVGNAYIYTPTPSSLGSLLNTLSINFPSSVPGTTTQFKITGLYYSNGQIYATGNGYYNIFYKFSAVVAGNESTNQTVVAAVSSTSATNYSLVGAIQNSNFLLANSPNGIQGKLINNVTSPVSSHNGNLTVITSINYAESTITYNNLPSGKVNVEIEGFTGTPGGFMVALIDGAILVSTESGFAATTTILNNSAPDTIVGLNSIGNGTFLANAQLTNNGVPGSGNLYYTANYGSVWIPIPLANLPLATNQGALVGATVTTSGNLYIINTTDGINQVSYQTATPQLLSTWVPLAIVYSQGMTNLNGSLYAFTTNSESVGIYNQNTGQFAYTANALPTNYVTGGNIASNGSYFAQAQPYTHNIWTSGNILSNWISTTAVFNPDDSFNNSVVLINDGKVWITNGGGSNIYTSTDGINFNLQYINSVPLNGVPRLFN